jgi:hypothetical protein
MTIPNTVSEYSRYAAQEFLQTVVFIDDRIYEKKSGAVHEPSKLTAPKHRKKVTKAQKQQSETMLPTETGEENEEYSPHDVVHSFAKKQIICSLYQPGKNTKVTQSSDIYLLCRSADIVIVDWDWYGKNDRALDLIEGLINQAVKEVPEQLRLILVYTQELNLFAIADQLFQKINESLGEEIEPIQEEGGLALHTTNSRVSILGKTGRKRVDTHPDHIVKEKELANVAVTEFAKLASGLLHAATLLGLAMIKKNSRKILSRFNSLLDPAFLAHRALSLPNEDASRHLIPLLISEIEAVLEDKLENPIISELLIEDWCRNEWKPGPHVEELLGVGADQRQIATDFCLKGKGMRADHITVPLIKQSITKKGEWTGERDKLRNIASLLADKNVSVKNHEFSRLMSSRTFYKDDPKSLQLGTIVYLRGENNTKTYMLCLMPVCDSMRLKDNRKFVFAELEECRQDGKNKASIALFFEDSTPIELLYTPRAYNTYIAEFTPDKQEKQVLTGKSQEDIEIFRDTSGLEYVWVDQLKIPHAQRAAEQFARELSRIGLTESEWQRLLDK